MIDRIASRSGMVCGLALDHRDSMLAPIASVVLLDTDLGVDAMRERGPRRSSCRSKRRATKLLLPYPPELADAARRQEETVATVVASCRAAGVLSIIEPIVFGEVPQFGATVIETARRLARLGPDVLKLQ